MARGEALALGLALAGFSVVMLGLFANAVAAALLAFTIFFYAVVYSMWLKRATPQNIVIGGAAGALPPVIGWAVATGGRLGREPGDVRADLPLDAAALLGAGALPQRRLRPRRGADAAGDGRAAQRRATTSSAMRSCWPLAALAPAFSGIGGPVYLAGALVLNALFAARRLAGLAARRGGGRGGPLPRREAVLRLLDPLPRPCTSRSCWPRRRSRALDLTPAGWPVARFVMRPDSHEIYGRRRSRNLGLGLTLAAFVVLIFAVTVVKLCEGADMRGFDHTREHAARRRRTEPMARPGSNRRIGLALFAVVPVMVALSFAAVPFYSWFCRVTGYRRHHRRRRGAGGAEELGTAWSRSPSTPTPRRACRGSSARSSAR